MFGIVRPDNRDGSRIFGIACLVGGVAIISLQDLIIKLLSDTYPVHQNMVIRGAVSAPILLLIAVKFGGLRSLMSDQVPLLMLRGGIMFTAFTAYFLGLAALPMATCVALYFVGPIFITVLSAIFLGERVGLRRWSAVAAGFVGVLWILRPGAELFVPGALLPIYAGLAYAMSAVLARKLGARQGASVMAFYSNGSYLVGGMVVAALLAAVDFPPSQDRSLQFLLRDWAVPQGSDALLLFGGALIATLGTLLLTQAYRVTQASHVAPFEYTALLWGGLYGWVFWSDFPEPAAWPGIAIVIMAGLYLIARRA